LKGLEETAAKLPEKRKDSNARRNYVSDTYGILDVLKNIVDEVEPAGLSEIFDKALQLADGQGIIEQYRVLDLPRVSGFLGFDTNGRGSGLKSEVSFIGKNTLQPLFAQDKWKENGVLPQHDAD
jgi:hypothetical protein